MTDTEALALHLQSLPPAAQQALLADLDMALQKRRLDLYVPNRKQYEFHQWGASKRQRLLMAGNQLGKTLSAGAEYAMHVSGRYPDWWVGKTFDKEVVGWAAGVSSDALRDGVQRMLFGRTEGKDLAMYGTGMIPADALRSKPSWRMGNNAVMDTAIVRHGGGGDVQAGHSVVILKSYEQGRGKFQADTLDLVWLDEEPPYEIYTESLTRTNARLGPIMITFTPLMGRTKTVNTFLQGELTDAVVIKMMLDDVDHYSPEHKAAIIAAYLPHERQARINGIPSMGDGAIFPISEETLKVTPFEIPPHWYHIVGIDFGWDHPTAFTWMAIDRDTDTYYVIATYRVREQPVSAHAATLRAWGTWLPVAWPHDGHQHDKGSGLAMASQYVEAGVKMLDSHAHFLDDEGEPAGYSREAGLSMVYDAMVSGRFKVFSHLHSWFEEFRNYHRKEGKVVDEMDDILSSTRYAMMSARYAIQRPSARVARPRGRANWRTA